MDLELASRHCRLLADSTRLRLLLLLEHEELSVAELAAITQLAQPRVSTHLAKLREADLVMDRREGVFVYYRIASTIRDRGLDALWQILRSSASDPMVQQDRDRIPKILNKRTGHSWADSVAGDMERHYSPGRTWEATAHGLAQLIVPGKLLDIASGDGVNALLLAPRAEQITCIDISEKVVAAGRKRLEGHHNVHFKVGDMHDLPLPDRAFDTVLLMHALTYTRKPQVVFNEAARVLKTGGQLLAVTLAQHKHEKAVRPYDHANLGFTAEDLRSLASKAGLSTNSCTVATTEKRAPHFSILALSASRT